MCVHQLPSPRRRRHLEENRQPRLTPQGTVVIPKSVSQKRIVSNSKLFDWEIDAADMDELDALDEYLVRAASADMPHATGPQASTSGPGRD